MLRRGGYRTVAASDDAMAFIRGPVADVPGPAVVVALNSGDGPATLVLDAPDLAGTQLVQIAWPGMPSAPAAGAAFVDGRAEIHLPPRAGHIFRAKRGEGQRMTDAGWASRG